MNKQGLSRDIPREVKRQIRVNSGFGCVICGFGIINYEHVDPEYHDAKTHDPSRMTLLCFQCHGQVTTGMWSKDKVKEAMLHPKALEKGYSNGFFDIGNKHPEVHFAGTIFKESAKPITVSGVPIIQIKPPEEESGRFLLSADFFDKSGLLILKIVDNEWMGAVGNWDFNVVGRTITIREKERSIALELTAHPPDAIEISKAEMFIPSNGNKLKGDAKSFQITGSSGGGVKLTGCTFEDNRNGDITFN